MAFLVVAVGDLAIRFGHPEPIAIFTKMIEGLLRVVAADRVLAQFAIDASEGDINTA
ncbi:hypothetical protein D3C83_107270 [compost metagenome]